VVDSLLPKKSFALLLPPPPFEKSDLDAVVKKAESHFDAKCIGVYCRKMNFDIEYYGDICDDWFWIDKEGELAYGDEHKQVLVDMAIILSNRYSFVPLANERIDWVAKKRKCYMWNMASDNFCEWSGSLITQSNDGMANSHYFGRAATDNQLEVSEYVYYPYGFFVRQPMLGDINEFGFRVPLDYQKLSKREVDHKLVCVFGGSAAWGVLSPSDKSFCALLGGKLNCDDTKYTVLNFGMPSYLVLNEMIAYTMFARQLKPDVVISFSGYNDLHHGMLNDRYLLENFAINYACWQESWAAKLRGLEMPAHDSWYMDKSSIVKPIVDTYVERIEQFRQMAEVDGSKFVLALQPFWGSKKEHSGYEITSFRTIHHKEPEQPLLSVLEFLYDRLRRRMKNRAQIDIDFDALVSSVGREKNFFGDIVHLIDDGEEFIADELAIYLRSIV